MLDIPLSLQPRYRVTLTLSAPDARTVSLSAPEQSLLLQAAAVLRGEPGPSGATARRHAWASPHDYAATAPAGTVDTAAGWAITRITVAADGTTTVAHASGAWTDRATLAYT